MSRQTYRTINLRPETRRLLSQILEILDEYKGMRLTARQVYYQCVSRDLLGNTVQNYKRLTGLLTDARYAGYVDWNIIEDRGRRPNTPSEWSSLRDLVETALDAYRLPRWGDQQVYVEVWVEKQALEGVLLPITRRWHVPLMVNKGYSSASAMKEAADRIMRECGQQVIFGCEECSYHEYEHNADEEKICGACGDKWRPHAYGQSGDEDREVHILYLGDHDPSGEDMVRDIRERLTEFGVCKLHVRKIGLTMKQIRELKPPPNPAKITDSRAAAYIAKFGDKSWELDALPPRYLTKLVDDEIADLVDKAKLDVWVEREDADKEQLRKAVAKIMKGGKR